MARNQDVKKQQLDICFQFHEELDVGVYGVHVVSTPLAVHGELPDSKHIFCLCQCISLIYQVPGASLLIAVMNILVTKGKIPY